MNIYAVLRTMNTYKCLAPKVLKLYVSISFAEGFHWVGLTRQRVDSSDLDEAKFKWLWLDGSGVEDIVTDHGDQDNNECAGLGIIMAKSRSCHSEHRFICQRGNHIVAERFLK